MATVTSSIPISLLVEPSRSLKAYKTARDLFCLMCKTCRKAATWKMMLLPTFSMGELGCHILNILQLCSLAGPHVHPICWESCLQAAKSSIAPPLVEWLLLPACRLCNTGMSKALPYSLCASNEHDCVQHLFVSKTSLSHGSLTEGKHDMYARLCGMQLVALQAAADTMHAFMQLWQHGPASKAVDYREVSGGVEQGTHPRPICTHCPGRSTHTRDLLFLFTTYWQPKNGCAAVLFDIRFWMHGLVQFSDAVIHIGCLSLSQYQHVLLC